jgi:hypothetical protein
VIRQSDTVGADVLFEKVFSRDIRISVVRVRVCVLFALLKDNFTKRASRTERGKEALSVLAALFVNVHIRLIGKVPLKLPKTRARV